jgi:hypothetical protein
MDRLDGTDALSITWFGDVTGNQVPPDRRPQFLSEEIRQARDD